MKTKKIIIIALTTLGGFAALYYLRANTDFFGMFYHNNWQGMGSGFYNGHMMAGGFMHFIFWLILLFFIMSISSGRKESYAHASDSAIEILKKQYVNGKISKAEFSEKLKYLNQ